MKWYFTFGLLGLLCGSALGQCDKYSLQSAQHRCFSQYGLQVDGGGTDAIQHMVQNNPGAVCNNKVNFQAALTCAMDKARSCLTQLGQNPDILPDTDRVVQGITSICDNAHNIDSDCITSHNAIAQDCVRRDAMAAFSSGNANLDVTYVTCKAFEITVNCLSEEMSICRGIDILVYFTQHYLTPPACHSGNTPRPEVIVTMAPMTTAELVTGVPALPYVSCYNQSSIQEGQQTCFANEGIDIHLPEFHVKDGRQKVKQSYLDALMSNSKDFRKLCRNMAKYQRGMGCAMEVARKCLPYDYKDYIPTGRKVQVMLSELCRNIDVINEDCVMSKASALFDCGYRKGMENPTRNMKTLLCNAFRFNAECQRQELSSCGCRTTQLYLKISKEYLNPPACSPIYVSAPPCMGVSDAFYGSGGVSTVASVGLLALAALFAGWGIV